MSTVQFISAANAYAKLCVFDEQEASLKTAKKEFKEAYSAFRKNLSSKEEMDLYTRINWQTPHAAIKINDWASKNSFVKAEKKVSEKEVFEKAGQFEDARTALRDKKEYKEYRQARKSLIRVIVELGQSGGSLEQMMKLLNQNSLSELAPRVEKLFKYVDRQ